MWSCSLLPKELCCKFVDVFKKYIKGTMAASFRPSRTSSGCGMEGRSLASGLFMPPVVPFHIQMIDLDGVVNLMVMRFLLDKCSPSVGFREENSWGSS